MNKGPLKTRSDFAIAIILSLAVGIIIGHYKIPGFLVSLFQAEPLETISIEQTNHKPSRSGLKTYYQWFDINGKMRISQYKPKDTADYITFEGSQDLRDVSYQIDQKMLAKGLAYRNKILSGGNSRKETDIFLSDLLTGSDSELLSQDIQCAGLTGWLNDISQTVATDKATKGLFCEKYQTRLQTLQQIGCSSTLKSFETLVCE